jgi:hypothetical protein
MMRKAYPTAAGKTNLPGASSCRRNEAGLQTNSLVMRAVHAFWPTKTMLELREATGASDRMIQYWLANRYALSAADLAGLLRTEAGFAVLESIMGGAKPVWWKRFRRSVATSTLRAEQAAHRRRLEQLEMEFDE